MREFQIKRPVLRYFGLAVTMLLLILFWRWNLDRTITVYAFGQDANSAPDGTYMVNSGIEGGTIEESGMKLYYEVCGERQVSISGYSYTGQGDYKLVLPGYINHGPDDTKLDLYTVVGINGGVFKNFSHLREVNLAPTYEWIGAEAFMNCPLSESGLSLNDGLTTIRDRAFYGCSGLRQVTIGASVTSLGTGVFANCASLKTISVSNGNPNYCSEDYILYSKDKTELIQCPAAWSVVSSVVSNYTVGSAKCPVRVIGNQAFEGCTFLTNIEGFCSTVTTIGEKAFYGCRSLASVKIPGTVGKIGEQAFSNCSPWLQITCNKGSYAETFAKNNSISTSVLCTVNFYDGGTLLKTQEVVAGGSASPPVVSERSGYTLTWDKDYTNVQQNLNVYTSWKQNYTVTFRDDYSGQVTETTTYYGGAATPPVWTRRGYLLSWDTTSYTYVTKNLTVNAVWLVSMTDEAITEEKPQIGETRTIGYITYQVTRTTASDPRVKAVGCTKQTLTTLTIPDRITFGGTNFKVTNIGVNAFRDMPKLTTLSIGKYVVKINRAAFYNCPKLKKITIHSKKLSTVIEKAFSKTYVKAKVNVPNAYIEKYKSYLQDAGLSVHATVY